MSKPSTPLPAFRSPLTQLSENRRPPAASQSSSQKLTRINATPSGSPVFKPFKCPGSAAPKRESALPPRKRRKVDYSGADGTGEGGETSWTAPGAVLALREANKLPVFKVKDAESTFRTKFAIPFSDKTRINANRPTIALGMRRGANFVPKALHDPTGEFAIVLYDPTIDDKKEEEVVESSSVPDVPEEGAEKAVMKKPNKSLNEILGIKKQDTSDIPRVAVVIDPRLAKVLRPHQIEGVKFLYRATTGLIDSKAHGCIMADEMGLGKTLQCITLMWTLLKQSPEPGKPTIRKCVIACPSSLVRNWANELVKWLGEGTIHPFAVDGKGTKEELISQLKQWAIASGNQIVRPVLIVSYETLRLYAKELGNTEIGLMLCDEGHRLKNGESQTFTSLTELNVKRRVILSGTPIQNDLTEYFSLLNFANPDYLGSRGDFRKMYEMPILRGRDANSDEKTRQKGDERLRDLFGRVNKFIIRRTNDILSKYLPVKYEHVVFCNLAPFQKDLYNHFVTSSEVKKLLRGVGCKPLKAINVLKKLCNHPDLLNLPDDLHGSEQFFPDDFIPKGARGRENHRYVNVFHSGKMLVLDRMLRRIRQDTNDKIVLISNYTQTLDVFERLARANNYGFLRLDGTMTVNKRQKLVDKFNDPEGDEFIFLLSSKAGGCGLNLIGANRLVLFDPDWNPAADQQALARVWRDGQKKDCFVYRFIATGTIEEKIFQRQSHKQSLSSCVVDEAQDVERHFGSEDLRKLFEYNTNTRSDTHDTFKCKRCKPDGKQYVKAPAMLYGDTSTWNHFAGDGMGKIEDLLLRQEGDVMEGVEERVVSEVFQYISH
ncbi:DNA-dependent ATPase protein rad54 [Orbilia ellipsospora]|uniref:DNA-dependent ATPase protein rad54 n=1 Tax=Orbilia ellipsospora TaxID=2528407 RepID=A0AAV9XDZ2_9PEZI